MTSDNKPKWHRIPIRFHDPDRDDPGAAGGNDDVTEISDEDIGYLADEMEELEQYLDNDDATDAGQPEDHPDRPRTTGDLSGGPEVAELVATRAELKRVEGEVADLKDRLARRQADFENYRKRTERERTETYNRVVADIAGKLLPVLDNLRRALDAEATVESSESDEFRHFLSGVDLIYKQLDGIIDALGVKPIEAEGQPFNPHLHEAVVSEATDDYEPDTVMQEIVKGYRMGDKLIRPSMVKVAVKK